MNDRNYLTAVSAQSAGDVWAVGWYFDNALQAGRTLIEHWDGTNWQIMPSPNPYNQGNDLFAVTVISAGDVWAAGSGSNSGDFYAHSTLIHWNGTAWSVAVAPVSDPEGETLIGISGVTTNDVWAAGTIGYGSTARSLLAHWNGSAWTQVPAPSAGAYMSSLAGIQARTATDIWAVGNYALDESGFGYATLVLHGDGSAWTVVPSPNGTIVPTPTPSPPSCAQRARHSYAQRRKRPITANRCVGRRFLQFKARIPCHYRSLTEHWDGAAWSVDYQPQPHSR